MLGVLLYAVNIHPVRDMYINYKQHAHFWFFNN